MLGAEQAAELKASAERLALAVGYRGAGTVEFLYHPGEQAVRLPRGQHPAAGRAPDHRDHHRHRPGQGCSCTWRPAAGSRATSRPRPGTPSRRGSTPRTPTATSRPSPGRIARLVLPAGPGHPGGHRRQRGRHHPGRLRLDDREDHRVRPRPRRGAGPAAPRDGRDHGDHRGRRDQQELRARPARPARGDRRERRHRLDRPGTRRGPPGQPPALRGRAGRRRDRGVRGRGGGRAGSGCCPPRTAGARRCSTRAAARWTSSCAASATGCSVARVGAAPVPRRHLRRRRRRTGGRRDRAVRRAQRPDRGQRRTGSGWSSATHGPIHLVEVDGVTHRISRDEGGVVRSPAPALVVATPLAVGDEVEAGAPMLVLESMKMETVLRAPFRARRARVPGVGGQPGRDRRAAAAPGAARRRRAPRTPARRRGRRDRPARRAGGRVRGRAGRRAACRTCAACCSASTSTRTTSAGCSPATWPRAAELGRRGRSRARSSCSTVFADLSELSRNRPARRARPSRTARCTARASTSTATCRASTSSGPGCRRASRPSCAKVLAHYGVDDLDRTPELEAAVFRIFLAQQRDVGRRRGRVATLLRAVAGRAAAGRGAARARRARPGAPGRGHPGALPGGRRPGPRRGVPLVRPAAAAPQPRQGLRRRSATHLRYLDAHPDAPDRAERIADDGGQRRAAGPADRPADRPRRARTTRRCWRC